ncbi:glutathione S-transferase C-terminal-like protein [Fomitopsis betulina]|nr:glutathione S-transferase C-terminal-like protein [Fomitopsis betulina]
MSTKADSGRSYHQQCTGVAKITADAHSVAKDITLLLSFHEVDPYKKPKPANLLEVSPKGLVPALRLENHSPPRAVNESTVILEFLEDIATTTTKRSLLPPVTDPYARALVCLQADHVNRTLVPAFYRYIQAQDEKNQIQSGKEFVEAINGLLELFQRAENESQSNVGLWHEGGTLSLADVMAGPCEPSSIAFHRRGTGEHINALHRGPMAGCMCFNAGVYRQRR